MIAEPHTHAFGKTAAFHFGIVGEVNFAGVRKFVGKHFHGQQVPAVGCRVEVQMTFHASMFQRNTIHQIRLPRHGERTQINHFTRLFRPQQ